MNFDDCNHDWALVLMSLRLLRVMSPILQTFRTPTLRVLLRLTFLRKVALVIRDDLAHVLDVFFVVFARIFLWVLLQDLNDLAAAGYRVR